MSQKESAVRVTLGGRHVLKGWPAYFVGKLILFSWRETISCSPLLVSLNIASFFFVCIELENIVQCKGTILQLQHHE